MAEKLSSSFQFIKFPKEEKYTAWNSRIKIRRTKFKRVRRFKKGKSKNKPKIAKLSKIKTLEAKLKSLLYPLIKKRDGNTCISCGKKNLSKHDWQAGHYIKAELCNIVWRYNEMNINSQCGVCNLWRRGNTIEYRKEMVKKYGEEKVKKLEQCYNEGLILGFNEREYLLKLIEHYAHKTAL